MNFITVTKTGTNIVTGAASASSAIPVASSGALPSFVRISATANARVTLGIGSASAVATDMLVSPADAVVIAVPRGVTHVAAIQDTAAGVVNVTPIEDC